MSSRRAVIKSALALGVLPLHAATAPAQVPPADAPAERAETPLFAVELRTGPSWDPARQTHEQAHFREHSASLRRLREQQILILGARYSDKGFLVLATANEQEARKLIEQDPAIQNQVFTYTLSPFAVFYAGCVQAPRRRG